MASTDLAAKRYAQAAFELAVESNSLDGWAESLKASAEFMGQAEVAAALENTRVPVEIKNRLIDAGLSDQPASALNLARLLVQKGRTGLASEIVTEFVSLSETQRGIVRATAITAVPLSEADRQGLTQRLQEQTGKQIILDAEVDENLIGGLVVQIGDRVVDMSTRARLRSLRENLTGAV